MYCTIIDFSSDVFTCVAFSLFSVMTSANVRLSDDMSGVFPPAAATQMLSRPQRGRNKHLPISQLTNNKILDNQYYTISVPNCMAAVQTIQLHIVIKPKFHIKGYRYIACTHTYLVSTGVPKFYNYCTEEKFACLSCTVLSFKFFYFMASRMSHFNISQTAVAMISMFHGPHEISVKLLSLF